MECLDDQDLLHTMDEGQYEATARKEWQRAQKSRFHNKGDARGQPNRSRTIHERSVHIAPRVRTMSLPPRQEEESPLEHPTRRQRTRLSPAPAVGLGEGVELVEFQVVWGSGADQKPIRNEFSKLRPEDGQFPYDWHGKSPNGAPESDKARGVEGPLTEARGFGTRGSSRGGADETRSERTEENWRRKEYDQFSNKGERNWTACATT